MPLPLSPEETFWLSLKSDEHLPEASRPAFQFRHLSGRQQRPLAEMLDDLSKTQTTLAESVGRPFETLRGLLIGWRNLTRPGPDGQLETIPYDPAMLEDVLQSGEATQLLSRVCFYRIPEADLGNSDSQSSTPSGESASPAAAPTA